MTKAIENRLERLWKSVSEQKLDAFLVLAAENRRYLSGFSGEDTQFDESAGALLISDTRLILATDSRYDLQAEIEAPLYEIRCYKEGLAKALPELLKEMDVKRLGFESIRMSCFQYNKIVENLGNNNLSVDLVGLEDIVEGLRIIKQEAEIDATKKAISIAESVFGKMIRALEPGMTEKETAWAMERGMREAGADALSFPSIVAAGPNSALPHAIPGDRKIKEGEPVLFDWGAKLNGYCSDTSRTVVIGKPDETFKKVYKTVLDAQEMAIAAIMPGASSKSIDAIARNHIASMGFKEKFGHGLGHGTGLAIHEAPRLSPFKDISLETGMIFTVEPGIYLPGWGGVRIENQVVVRDSGAEILNSLSAQLSSSEY